MYFVQETNKCKDEKKQEIEKDQEYTICCDKMKNYEDNTKKRRNEFKLKCLRTPMHTGYA